MNLVLTHCWREWRAQRGMLCGLFGLGVPAMCLAFLVFPEHVWSVRKQGALCLAWFVVLAAIAVIAFVAPGLVRTEYGSRGDQFVRRVPGALSRSLAGKLLYLTLASVALPLLALCTGQLLLWANGQHWNDLFAHDGAGAVTLEIPWPAVAAGYAALLVPWVWAVAMWLPGGRMAIGGVAVLLLLLGLGVVAVLRVCPGLEKNLAWQQWLPLVPVVGLVTAATSWLARRRGGGVGRSAVVGLATTAIGLLPAMTWFGLAVRGYHRPDPQRLGKLYVHGVTPDLRFALAMGAEHDGYRAYVPFRIDLSDGTATQIGDVYSYLLPPGGARGASVTPSRFWVDGSSDGDGRWASRPLDLSTGRWGERSYHASRSERDQAALAAVSDAALRDCTLLRAPGGVPVWFRGQQLCFQVDAERIERMQWPGELSDFVRASGHGLVFHRQGKRVFFDLAAREVVADLGDSTAFFVGGITFVKKNKQWLRRDANGAAWQPQPELGQARWWGLLDDRRVLFDVGTKRVDKLAVWDLDTATLLPIDGEFSVGRGGSVTPLFPMGQMASLMPRDPAGKIWFQHDGRIYRLDPDTLRFANVPMAARNDRCLLLGWPDAGTALLQIGVTIHRLDVATGALTQVFPR